MSIANYSELQSAIADWLNRQDLTTTIPTFIALAEADMSRKLRHWRQQRRVVTTLNEQFEVIPSDFLEMSSITLDHAPALRYAGQDEMSRMRVRSGDVAGEPKFYNHDSGQIEFYPTPDDDYTLRMIYYARVPALSDTDTFNWVLTHYPDIYLYGSLLHSAPYLGEDARAATWVQMYSAAIELANMQSNKTQGSGSALVMRVK